MKSPQSTPQNTAGISPTQHGVLALHDEVLTLFRDTIDSGAPVQVISAFYAIASAREPLGVMEVGKIIGQSNASASRLVSMLGRGVRAPSGEIKPGAQLVEASEDPMNYSRKIVTLTAKGKRLLERLEEITLKHLSKLA